MDDLSPSDLKVILHSKRANMYYLEYCRVMQKDGRVLYLTEADKENLYFNIPIANTTVLMLGNGTSITQAAMRMLSQAGVLVGFCGGGGTPLHMACEVEWFTPQSEYRPTEYLQGWLSFWFDDEKRLAAAKQFQNARIDYLQRVWRSDRELTLEKFNLQDEVIKQSLDTFHQRTEAASNRPICFSRKRSSPKPCTSTPPITQAKKALRVSISRIKNALTKPTIFSITATI